VPPDSQPFVQASFDYADYAKLTAGRKVFLTLSDGLPQVSGTIYQVMMNGETPQQTLGAVNVLVKPDHVLPAAMAGAPVAVSVAPGWLDQWHTTVTALVQKLTQTEAG